MTGLRPQHMAAVSSQAILCTLTFHTKGNGQKVTCDLGSSRRSGRYMSCGENHGVKPPNPEQYWTPLQQKEVTVRHLKTKLKESERRLHER